MSPLFITALVWFVLGFAFHAGLIWYDERQKRKAWHRELDRFLRDHREERKRRNNARVLDAVREVTRDRQDVAWKN